MTRRAWVYIWSVLLLGAGASAMAFASFPAPTADQWLTFGIFVSLATLAQLHKASAPSYQSYHITLIFMLAGAVLLSPALFVPVVALPHLIEWAKERWVNSPRLRHWYLQPFNITTHILAGFTARWVFGFINPDPTSLLSLTAAYGLFAGALVYVLLNHLLVGLGISLGRKVSLRASGVLALENLQSDFVLLMMGATAAVLWTINPLLIIAALSPLVLMYQALKIPQLKKDAATDGKTGLWNSSHFSKLFTAELNRAKRFNHPLALMMADLDLLRNINNTYGHLAGDAVLAGVGKIIREAIRDYDIPGRFGGEEFAIALPETGPLDAWSLAERIRQSVQDAVFESPTSRAPIRVTVSIGIAFFPEDARETTDLIHQADIAVYQAKLQGRDRIVGASTVSRSAQLETIPQMDRLEQATLVGFTPRPQVDPQDAAPRPVAPFEDKKNKESRSSESLPPRWQLALFVGGTIALGILLTALGFRFGPPPSASDLSLLFLLALAAQLPQVKNLYGDSSISVSVVVNFAAALIAGIPGVACVSAAIVILHHIQRRPRVYKTFFNWSTHVLAGVAPFAAINLVPNPFQFPNLVPFAFLTLVAAMGYYAIDTGLVTMAISLSQGKRFGVTWVEQCKWLAPHYLALCVIGLFLAMTEFALGVLGAALFLIPVLMIYYAQRQFVERSARNIQELKRMNEELGLANREVNAASTIIRALNEELFMTLSKIIDASDPYVHGHSAQVADCATAIARELGVPQKRVEVIRQAAFLHDIGKIGISEHVLNKPGKLTSKEYEYVKTHARLGGEFLSTSQGLRHLAPFVRWHHERWDGAGYPDQLRGEQTPLEARIISICDAVETMASHRPYRLAMSRDDIVAEIKRCSGTQFDPAVVEACVRVLDKEGERILVNSAEQVANNHVANENVLYHTTGWLSDFSLFLPSFTELKRVQAF